MLRLLLAWAIVGAGLEPATAAERISRFRPPAQQIVCESHQFQRQACPADTRGGVRLLQQTGGACTRGVTWGYTRAGVWVDNGCRAIFAVIGGPGGRPGHGEAPGQLIVCASYAYRPARCAANLHRRPRIEVIAGTCVEHRSWGWDRAGIWVKHGCRARFVLA